MDFSFRSWIAQYSTGTTSIVSTSIVITPNSGIAIDTITSEPWPVEVSMVKENPAGTTISELFSNTESYWFDIVKRVCKSGKVEMHTAYHSETAKSWDSYVFITDPAKDEVAMLFAEHINPDDPRKKANSYLFEMAD